MTDTRNSLKKDFNFNKFYNLLDPTFINFLNKINNLLLVNEFKSTKFVYVNDRVTNTLGYSRREFFEMKFLSIIHPSEINRIKNKLNHLKLEETLNFGIINCVGLEKNVFLSAISILVSIDKNKFVFTIAKDLSFENQSITKSKLFNIISDAIIITDIGGKITSWNNAAKTMYGYSTENVIGKDEFKFLGTKLLGKGEISQITKVGKKLIIQTTITNIKEQNRIIAKVSVNRDVTETRRIFNELKNQKNELSMFAKTMSHDLRNNLSLIRDSMHVILEIKDTIETENIVDNVCTQVDLIESVLTKSAELADSGQIIGKKISTNLIKNIEESSVGMKHVSNFKLTFANPLPIIVADQMKLFQVFKNIIENNLKHSKASEIIVQGELRDSHYFLTISNNGIRFKLSLNELLRKPKGMGLNIIKKILDSHDWGFEIISNKFETKYVIKIPNKDVAI